jgi:hypothetical protein
MSDEFTRPTRVEAPPGVNGGPAHANGAGASASAKGLPATLAELRASGWKSRSVKQELRANMIAALRAGEELFPGVVGYEESVIPAIVNAVIAGHDMLFLGEKGQGKSRLMRAMVRFLDERVPYLDIPGSPVKEDPEHPIRARGASCWRRRLRSACRSRGGGGRIATPSASRRGRSSPT